MKRFYIIFEGQVQGVGFRYTLMTLAERYHLVGSCKNLYNGNVELFIQGEKENIDLFMNDVFTKRGFIRIDEYVIKEMPLEDEHSFTVRY